MGTMWIGCDKRIADAGKFFEDAFDLGGVEAAARDLDRPARPAEKRKFAMGIEPAEIRNEVNSAAPAGARIPEREDRGAG